MDRWNSELDWSLRSAIKVSLTAASIHVTTTIETNNASTAETVVTILAAENTSSLSVALGVTVEAVSLPVHSLETVPIPGTGDPHLHFQMVVSRIIGVKITHSAFIECTGISVFCNDA